MQNNKNNINSYRDLLVWQKSLDLSIKIYTLTSKFSEDERYGLISQMRRAAVSIPSNIAEGRCRGTKKDFVQFLRIALGSCAELTTQLEICGRLSIIKEQEFSAIFDQLQEIAKMLNGLIGKLSSNTYHLTPNT